VLALLDLHGHSRKKDCFLYGCPSTNLPKAKEFAYLFSRVSPYINYSNCTFQIEKEKEGTARVVCFRELCNPHVYTLESSFQGSSKSKLQFTPRQYAEVGEHFLKSLLSYFGYEKVRLVTKGSEPALVSAR
jgi:hypothetical protein